MLLAFYLSIKYYRSLPLSPLYNCQAHTPSLIVSFHCKLSPIDPENSAFIILGLYRNDSPSRTSYHLWLRMQIGLVYLAQHSPAIGYLKPCNPDCILWDYKMEAQGQRRKPSLRCLVHRSSATNAASPASKKRAKREVSWRFARRPPDVVSAAPPMKRASQLNLY